MIHGAVEILPAQRLMIAARSITNISGPVALGSVNLMFPSEACCQEFLDALLAFRGKGQANDHQ